MKTKINKTKKPVVLQIFLAFAFIFLIANLINLTSAVTISNVDTNPKEVAPGESIRVEIDIENIFDDDVNDAEVSLNLNEQVVQSLTGNTVIPSAPFSPESSSIKYIEEIKDGDEETARFDLIADADAEAGTYKIPVELSYLRDGETQREEKEFTISITINSKPDLILDVEDNLIQNRKNTLNIRVTNIGLTKAKFLEIQMQGTGFEILSSDRVYIGDLDSDDFDTASFDVFLKSSSIIALPIILKYRDATNQQYTETETITAKVYSQEDAIAKGLLTKSNTPLYIGIVVIVIILWLIWRAWRKRRKRRKAEAGRMK